MILSFVFVSFHFECVGSCIVLMFCSYKSTYSVDSIFSFFYFSVVFIQALIFCPELFLFKPFCFLCIKQENSIFS